MTKYVEKRLQKLRDIMRDAGIDVMALVPGANLRYITGGVHMLLERPIVLFVPLDGQPVAVIPKLEVPLFKRHRIESHIIAWQDSEGYEAAFRAAMDRLNVAGKTIGVEGLRLRFFEGELLRKIAPNTTVTGIDDQLSRLRLHKDADEIALMRQAISISEQALQRTLDELRVGMSEVELANVLENHMKALGAEGLSFDTILHAGGNTALSHIGPLDNTIRSGDPVLFDFGAVVGGYCADITRVVFVNEVSPEFEAFYNVIKQANAAARVQAAPGVTVESVDIAARTVIREAGYADLVRTRVGHGIGLEVHEDPYIMEGNTQLLEPGMTFTIEPGIYEMDRIGVRIEDNMLITPDGSESLTRFERDIVVVEG